MELDYERVTESSDDGDSKQFMILFLAVMHYLECPEEITANAFRDVPIVSEQMAYWFP